MSQSSARPCAVAIVTSFVLSLAFGPGCTVRLEAGTYHTRQQVVQGFRGTFSGAGSHRTIIEPLAPLRVSQDENVLARPPSVENPWPILFLFIDADMDVVCVENLQRATVRLLDNRFDGVLSVYIENVSESLVEVRGNELTGSEAAAFVSAGGLRTPEGPGTVVIAGNTLRTGPEGHGVLISDTGDRPTLQVLAEGNLLELEEATAAVGGGATSVVVRGNVIRGSAAAGMRVGAAPHPETASGDDPEAPPAALGWVLLDNDVSALRADVAPIWVTDGATGTIVACRAGTDVRDEGVATTLACD